MSTAAALLVSMIASSGALERANPIKPAIARQHEGPNAAAGPAAADGAQGSASEIREPRSHPSLRFGDALQIDFKASVQQDLRGSYAGAEQTADLEPFELERGRVGINGTLFRIVEFEIERELTTTRRTDAELAAGAAQRTPWKDAFVDVRLARAAQVRAGRFKIPFGLDMLTGVTQGDFVYRTLAADYLAPSRDTGLMVHGRFFKRGLNYWAGAFAHDGDNARSLHTKGAGRTYAARITGRPLRAVAGAFDDLTIGAAFTTSEVANDSFEPNGLRFETTMTDENFFSPVYVSGDRRRWETDLEWMIGPASARAEYTEVRDERRGQGLGNVDLSEARYRSWYVSATWLVTGERKERPLRPAAELFNGGAGAFELAARYERALADSLGSTDTPFRNPRAESILRNGDRLLTLGATWYLHQAVVLQFNMIEQRLDDPVRSPVSAAPFWSRVVRLQFAL